MLPMREAAPWSTYECLSGGTMSTQHAFGCRRSSVDGGLLPPGGIGTDSSHGVLDQRR